MADLSNEFAAEAASIGVGGRRSRIAEIADALSDVDRAQFLAALADRSVPAIAIVRVMRRRGYTIGQSTISQHRRNLDDVERRVQD